MNRLTTGLCLVAVLMTAIGGGVTSGNSAAAQASVGITVFEDVNYGGRSATFVRDVTSLRSSGLEDRVSSLRVVRGEFWEVCEGRDFTGQCQVFTGDQPDLRDSKLNDKISSLRPVRRYGGGGPAHYSPLELFAGTQYSGQRVAVSEPTPDLRRLNFADRAISLRVPRGQSWEVCVNVDYDECRVVDSNVPDLSVLGLSRVISSVRPHIGGRGR
jgi:hypothetical protein